MQRLEAVGADEESFVIIQGNDDKSLHFKAVALATERRG